MENKKSLIPKSALMKAWFIWETFPQTCYNYERMMGQVVAHMFSVIIGFLYKGQPEKQKEVMKREIEFFNVHIEFGACILGMAIALEEQKAMGEDIPGEFITNLKTSFMGPLAMTMLIYFLLKKKRWPATRVILLIFVIGVLGGVTGILTT